MNHNLIRDNSPLNKSKRCVTKEIILEQLEYDFLRALSSYRIGKVGVSKLFKAKSRYNNKLAKLNRTYSRNFNFWAFGL